MGQIELKCGSDKGECTEIKQVLPPEKFGLKIQEKTQILCASAIEHNFKIPVIAQIRALELLHSEVFGNLSQAQKDVIDEVLASCETLNGMLDTLSMCLKFEGKNFEFLKEKFNIVKIIKESCRGIQEEISSKNIIFSVNPKVEDLEFFGDKKQISKMLGILIDYCKVNAGENSSVVCGLNISQDCRNLIFSIVFKNEFLTLKKIQKAFDFSGLTEKFDRVGAEFNLYLAKQIVTNHNGQISVNADSRGVFSFNIVLPNINVCKNRAN